MADVLTEDNKGTFLAEAATMDLSPIREKAFLVVIGAGLPNKVKFLCSSLRGPYNFTEMVQEVGDMWMQHQHHAKVIIPHKDPLKPLEILDENTIDYIECHYMDIITEEMLGGAFDEKPAFTHVAGTSSDTDQQDPRILAAEREAADAAKQDPSP